MRSGSHHCGTTPGVPEQAMGRWGDVGRPRSGPNPPEVAQIAFADPPGVLSFGLGAYMDFLERGGAGIGNLKFVRNLGHAL